MGLSGFRAPERKLGEGNALEPYGGISLRPLSPPGPWALKQAQVLIKNSQNNRELPRVKEPSLVTLIPELPRRS